MGHLQSPKPQGGVWKLSERASKAHSPVFVFINAAFPSFPPSAIAQGGYRHGTHHQTPRHKVEFPGPCSVLHLENNSYRGPWVAQLVKRPTSAQVMISQFVSSSPASGSVLTAQSLETASDSVSPHLSIPPLLTLFVSLSLNNK